jgi:hypothetical protein
VTAAEEIGVGRLAHVEEPIIRNPEPLRLEEVDATLPVSKAVEAVFAATKKMISLLVAPA